MRQAYVVTGSLTDPRTVTLDEALPLECGRVRVVIETLPSEPPGNHADLMAMIWEGQRRRGHVPPTREAVDAYLKAERESWDD
jgi:hypothetical protein